LTSPFAKAGSVKVASVEVANLPCISTAVFVEMQRTFEIAYVLLTEPRGVVGFEVILSAYTSLLSMAATGSVSLVS
jgi:hypothetical protein